MKHATALENLVNANVVADKTVKQAKISLIGVGLIIGIILGYSISKIEIKNTITDINISNPFTFSKWMKGSDLMNSEDSKTPEGQAMIAAFDRDNGKLYCVPKMSGAELGEFRASLPGLMIKNTMGSIFSGKIEDFDFNKPMEQTLRLGLTETYPCKG